MAKVVLFYVWMSKSWKLCKNYPCAHAITTYLQRKSWDRGKGWSISLWSLRCLYPDLSRLTGTTRCAVVKLEVTSTTVKQGNLSKGIGNKTIRRFSQGFTFHRCGWVFKSGWASSNVVGKTCPSGCNRVNWAPNSGWAKAHPAHPLAAPLYFDAAGVFVKNISHLFWLALLWDQRV